MPRQNLSLMIARIPPKAMLLIITTLAVGAGVLVQNQSDEKNRMLRELAEKANHKEMAQLLVANRDIPAGRTISAEDLRLDSIEAGKLPIGALQNTGAALGLQARVDIRAGESIMSQSISMKAKPEGFQAKIPDGFRAVTFPVDSNTGVSGFLSPDCHVDILVQSGSGDTLPILSDVLVIAVGQTFKKNPGETEAIPSASVTVAVKPSDAGKLINAMTMGRLYCLMRNNVDRTPLAVRDISLRASEKTQPLNQEISSSAGSSLPAVLPVVQAASEQPDAAYAGRSTYESQHNVTIWSANKRDALPVPKE